MHVRGVPTALDTPTPPPDGRHAAGRGLTPRKVGPPPMTPTDNHTEQDLRRAADWAALLAWTTAPDANPVVLAGVIAAVERLESDEHR